MIESIPLASRCPRSPVCMNPSVSKIPSLCSGFKYPGLTVGPFARISPSGVTRIVAETTGGPTVPIFFCRMVFTATGAVDSVKP